MPIGRSIWKQRKPELIWGGIALVSLAYLCFFQWNRHLHVDSANAILDGYSTTLGTPDEGEVVAVYAEAYQAVKKGQVLCRLEESRYRTALLEAQNRFEALQARREEARRNNVRSSFLYRREGISRERRDDDSSNLIDLDSQMRAAEAAVRSAAINLSRTQVLAPSDGILAFRNAQVGLYAKSGAPLFGFVPDSGRWVTAKVKETDLADFRPGDPVVIHFDAEKGKRFEGKVLSLPAATEVPFATLPQDPAAGNFTKFVQWHPVRVAVNLNPQERVLIPLGSSAEIRINRR